jgi:hypothetical protein
LESKDLTVALLLRRRIALKVVCRVQRIQAAQLTESDPREN